MNFGVEFNAALFNSTAVKNVAGQKEKTEAQLLDQATNQLLKAAKQALAKKQGRVDYDKLRKDGYSDRFLAKVQDA